VENLILTGSAGISGHGNELANALTGNAAGNELRGFAGNDLLDGGAGADVLEGGAGDDVYIVDNAGDKAVEAAAGGIDSVRSSVDFTLGSYIENLVLTGVATAGAGNALDNAITGNASANRLDGGGGADKMKGGDGDDVYIVDHGGDRAIEVSTTGGTDTVISSIGFTLGSLIENLVLSGVNAVNGTGNELDNRITGNAAANVLNGGAGADRIAGGAGNDTYLVENAQDQVVEGAGEGTDTVLSTISYGLSGNVENLTLGGTAGAGKGNDLANVLRGNSSDNVLKAYGGNDSIYGGRGNDSLSGGAGADSFFFDTKLNATFNVDKLLDFSSADDTIMLSRAIFGGIGQDGTLDAAAFVAGTAATQGGHRIVYDQASGNIWYDADGNGAAAAILFAQVAPGTALTNLDFQAYSAVA
jgi:Ca2+-binding RTX toxin-like protein